MSDEQKSEKDESTKKTENQSTEPSFSQMLDAALLKRGIKVIVDDSRAGQSFVMPGVQGPSKPQKPEAQPPPATDEDGVVSDH